jgi:chromate transporter
MTPESPDRGRPFEVFRAFLKLGCTSFGGPIAHLGYFQHEFVAVRRWLDEEAYADLVALCQFLPGPASSQVGLALGWRRAGWPGALAAWLGFTLPSVALMMAFAFGMGVAGDLAHRGWVQGLKVAAVAVVAQAVLGMARRLCPDRTRALVASAAGVVLALFTAPWVQLACIAGGALAGGIFGRWFKLAAPTAVPPAAPARKNRGILCLSLFLGLLLLLPWLAAVRPTPLVLVSDAFYRAGALVFGGGHVVLPLLQKATVGRGWIGEGTFLAGYGAAQALPGPLFAFSAYLGALMPPGGVVGGLLALAALYLPGVLVLFGTLPYWDRLRSAARARAVMAGTNAAVVGLLGAALYSPIWTTTIRDGRHFALALAGFAGLQFGRLPPWVIVAGCAVLGAWAFA